MRTRIRRLGYRLAAPLAHAWWGMLRRHHHGAKCAITHAGDVLLVRHAYGDRRSWGFPGGFVRRGEDPAAATARELGEELGLSVAADRLRRLGPIGMRIGRETFTIHYYHLELDARTLAPDPAELADAVWFDPAALPARIGAHVDAVLTRIPGANALASVATDPGSPDRG